jgi:hypothetical protein
MKICPKVLDHLKDKDGDQIGQKWIYWWDPKGQTHTISGVKWEFW